MPADPRHGASRETLLRRVAYGGWKGRSAARRLRRMRRLRSYAYVEVRVNGVLLTEEPGLSFRWRRDA